MFFRYFQYLEYLAALYLVPASRRVYCLLYFVTVRNRFMNQYLEFVMNHWVLVGLLIGLVITLIYTENLKRGAGISLHEATRVINQEDGVVVDIRSEKEFKEGHITSAINVPYPDLASRMSELDKHKEVPVILVCKMGQHSGAASKTLRDSGFSNVKRLNGGMAEWGNANMPVVKGAKG